MISLFLLPSGGLMHLAPVHAIRADLASTMPLPETGRAWVRPRSMPWPMVGSTRVLMAMRRETWIRTRPRFRGRTQPMRGRLHPR